MYSCSYFLLFGIHEIVYDCVSKTNLLAILYRFGLEPGVYLRSSLNISATTAAIFRCTKLAASSALGSGQLAVLWAASSAMGSLQCRGHYKLPKALQMFLRIFLTFVMICHLSSFVQVAMQVECRHAGQVVHIAPDAVDTNIAI